MFTLHTKNLSTQLVSQLCQHIAQNRNILGEGNSQVSSLNHIICIYPAQSKSSNKASYLERYLSLPNKIGDWKRWVSRWKTHVVRKGLTRESPQAITNPFPRIIHLGQSNILILKSSKRSPQFPTPEDVYPSEGSMISPSTNKKL